LGRLICIYDDNKISIEGSTSIAFTEDVAMRFNAYDWHVLMVEDGNDLDAITQALTAAQAETTKPSLIMLRTHIACGSPNKQDTADAHGAPLGEAEIGLTKECLGWPTQAPFHIPEEALAQFRTCVPKGEDAEAAWKTKVKAFTQKYPDIADQWVNALSGYRSREWDSGIPVFTSDDAPIATRAASGKVLNAIAGEISTLVGGSADLAPSNKTYLDGIAEFQRDCYEGRNIRFGVREHAMGAIMSGLFLHGGIRPYGGTFLVFADYMRPAIRVAALMGLPLIYVFTHDSIAVGEDGPTHQPVEHLASLRGIPNLCVIRPADANETADAWRQAIKASGSPVALVLSRQKLPVLQADQTKGGLDNGAYVLADCDGPPDVILIATGAEVHQALEAKQVLAQQNIAVRVVSMPSWELFEQTSIEYRNSVLPPKVTARIAIEAGIPSGWERYVGNDGAIIGMTSFGASAPGGTLLEKFGFTSEHIVAEVKNLLAK
jgi:transketolase